MIRALRLALPAVIVTTWGAASVLAGPPALTLARPAPAIPTPVPAAPVPPALPAYRWPLAGTPRVIAAFDPPTEPWLPGQRGVVLAAGSGQLVYAAGAGTVHFAGLVAGVGVVSIDHADGLRTTYEPVLVSVRRGQLVPAGTPIGHVVPGLAGCPAGVPACLHWGLLSGDTYLDPLALIGLGRVRLLP